MYEHLEEMEVGVAKILTEQREAAFASKKLIQLANVDISQFALEDLKFTLDYENYIQIL
jgi:5'-3' exonuclease